MSDDFKNSLRSAAGIPTDAEKQAKKDEQTRQREEWEKGAPAREAFLKAYTMSIKLLIDTTFIASKDVAKEGRHEISEARHFGGIPNILV